MYQIQMSCIHTQSGVYGSTKDTWSDLGLAQDTLKIAKRHLATYFNTYYRDHRFRIVQLVSPIIDNCGV